MDPSEVVPSAAASAEPAARADSVLPHLSAEESAVLDALSADGECLTVASLRARTGLESDILRNTLDGLRAKGLVARLNTVVEGYSARFPGLRVEHD